MRRQGRLEVAPLMWRAAYVVLVVVAAGTLGGCVAGEPIGPAEQGGAAPHGQISGEPIGDEPAAWQTARYPSIAADGAAQIYLTRPGFERGEEEDPEIDDAVIAAIENAESTVDLCLFEFNRDNIADAVVAAANRGVQVRFAGDGDELHDPGYEALAAAGVDLVVRKPGDRIMHNKFVIVDERIVFMGSMNYSENGIMLNNNNTIRIESADLAAAYKLEFDQMYEELKFGRSKEPNDITRPLPVGDTPAEVYFSPEDDAAQRLREVLASAEHNALFLIFSYTRGDVAADMKALHDSGVQVVGIFDESQARSRYSQVGPLAQHGVPVYIDGNHNAIGFAGGKLHHKVLIVDAGTDSDPTLVTGSFNWSNNANDYNDENMLILHGADFVAPFVEEFCALLERAAPHPDLANAPPDPCANLLTPLRINEIMPNPDGSDADNEYVEIVNVGGAPVELGGWMLGDASVADRHVFPAGQVLAPRDAVVIYSGATEEDPLRVVASTGYLGLANTSDEVVLRDDQGVVVDRAAWRGAPSGISFNRVIDGGTSGPFELHDQLPGGLNSSPGMMADGSRWEGAPHVIINEVLPNPDGTDLGQEYIELVNVGAFPVDLHHWGITDATGEVHHRFENYVLAPGEAVVVFDRGDHSAISNAINSSSGRLSLNNSDEVISLLDSGGQVHDQVAWASCDSGVSLNRAPDGAPDADLVNHDTLEGATGVTSPGVQANGDLWSNEPPPIALVINEIMPNPDGSDSGNEYVEIVNVGAGVADLTGWLIGDAVSPDRHRFEPGATLDPGQALVIYDSGDHSAIPNAINSSSGFLSLNNTTDVVTLTDPLGEVHDAVHYSGPPAGESLNRSEDAAKGAEVIPHSAVPDSAGPSSPGMRVSGAAF